MSLVKKAPELTEHRRGWLGKRGGEEGGELRVKRKLEATVSQTDKSTEGERMGLGDAGGSSFLFLLAAAAAAPPQLDSTRLDSTRPLRARTHTLKLSCPPPNNFFSPSRYRVTLDSTDPGG